MRQCVGPHGETRRRPLCLRNLRDSPRRVERRAYSFGEQCHMARPAAFQSVVPLRSFGLSGSGAVAPSAPAPPMARTGRERNRSLPQGSSDRHGLVSDQAETIPHLLVMLITQGWLRVNAWLLSRVRNGARLALPHQKAETASQSRQAMLRKAMTFNKKTRSSKAPRLLFAPQTCTPMAGCPVQHDPSARAGGPCM